MKRAVLYARVSGDDRGRDGRNLVGQLEMCREYAQERGYQIVDELAEDDRGASGARIDLPELTRARNMARSDDFDVLVVREIDRLSRNLAKQLIVEEELKRANVTIEYVLGEYPDTPEGNLQKHVKAAIAEYEREKINERMIRGRRQKVKDGHVILHGKTPYGYRPAEIDGMQTLEINEPEARIVRLIFRWCTVGDGENGPIPIYGIAKRLTADGIPTRGDKDPGTAKRSARGKWHRGTVANILHNETYAGVWYYGKNSGKGKNPDHYLISVKVPAIVSRETWQAAQKRMEQNKLNAKRSTKYNYLLRRRATCATCETKMGCKAQHSRGRVYQYYACLARRHPHDFIRKCTQPYGFRADHVDSLVWGWVRDLLLNPEATLEGLRQEQANREQASKPLQDRLAIVDDLLADSRAQLERVLDLYLAGDFPHGVLVERKERLQTTVSALERKRKDLAAQVEAMIIADEDIETIVEFATKVAQGLEEAERDFEKRRWVIEKLDVRVKLAVEDGQKVVHVQCHIGQDKLSLVSTGT
jgi:site-specific DNA recombinase